MTMGSEEEKKLVPDCSKQSSNQGFPLSYSQKHYTSSDWCLDELVKIMDCKRTLNQIVIPIFYDGEASDVRKQKGCYSFDQPNPSHRMQFDLKSVEKWRSALTEASHLSGHVLQNVANGCESPLIEIVVEEVADNLNRECLNVAEYPVGIQHRVEQLSEFLNLRRAKNDVRIVAIWGIGGIGKTTIAKAMYNIISREFDASSFLENVAQTSMLSKGLVELQKRLLCDLLMNENRKITSKDIGIVLIKQRAWGRSVLVLDDVDNISQLSALAINRDSLHPGSIIIITTRDLSSLSSLRLDKVNEVYEPKELNMEESLQLFCCYAFRRDHPVENSEMLSKEVVSYAKGLPLVLQILGCFLSYRTILEWECELNKLKKIPHNDVHGKVRLSFDSLDIERKGLFLHIACFFVGMDQNLSIKILEDFYPKSGIGILSRRCLVSIDGRNRLVMHGLIQDMAREIVRQESLEEPGERTRLWYHKDILTVLRNDAGTKTVQGLALNLPESEEVELNAKAFSKMERLRLLHLNYVHLSGSCKHISKRLVWLSWKGFSLKYIPSTLILDNLVAIDLSYSNLKQVWKELRFCAN
ncbi:disease resistance protein RUN1-like [Cornus florida]|uniref:disease resistance protein RUN1-like n=1 Tax=Cornus florida TaxID=4283 RepID=UPI002896F25B|nr:disease resistance protein RUN1-like [Cornus florida]